MRTKKQQEPTIINHCGECALGIVDTKHENLSLEGKPTLVSCPQSGVFKKVVSEVACSHFQTKN